MSERREDVSLQIRDADVVVHARGDLDGTTAGLLREALQGALAAGLPVVLLDLGEVAFMDSAGLAVVVRAQRLLSRDQRLILCNVPPRMTRVLQVTSFDAIFGVHALGDPWPWDDVRPLDPPSSAPP